MATKALRSLFRPRNLFLAGAAYYTYDYYFTTERILYRNYRTIKCGLNILYNYKIRFDADNYLEIHEFTAEDIYKTCRDNDGLYVKFGQGMAASDHVLPPPFFKHMSQLQDKAKSCTYEQVSKVFFQQEGKTIAQSFKTFDPEPVASASIAQVHRATLHSGEQVAVKIQKPNIRGQFASDMFMHTVILWVLEKAFDIPLLQFAEPIQRNLEKEVDFNIEADNAKLAQEGFTKIKRNDVIVPKIFDQFTSKRVLVTEWIDGIKITDENELKKVNFSKEELIKSIITAFAEQIFVTGFVHCDPHPGNIFVRKDPKNPTKPQIVILDHGLCIPIREEFRVQYAQFWKAMFLNDTETMRKVCSEWGMTFKESFASAQLLKPYTDNKGQASITNKDVMKMQTQMKDDIKEMMKSTKGFPEELLFIGRNMNLIRSLNKHYGSKVDRVSLMANTAVRGANTPDSSHPERTYQSWREEFRFRLTMWFLRLYNFYLHMRGSSVDDKLDELQKDSMAKQFEKYGFKPIDKVTYDA